MIAPGERVFVLGAGASHGCSFVNRASERPPLAASFLESVRTRERDFLEVFGLTKTIRRFYPNRSKRRRSWKDIQLEELLTLLEMEMESSDFWPGDATKGEVGPELRDLLSRYLDVLRIPADRRSTVEPRSLGEFLRFLSSIQLYMLQHAILGTLSDCHQRKLCAYHLRLAQLLRPGDTVITFNYDLIMDQALQECRPDLWTYADEYGLHFRLEADIENFALLPRTTPESQIRLLKLHGSCNWIVLQRVDHGGIRRGSGSPIACTGPVYYDRVGGFFSDAIGAKKTVYVAGIDTVPPTLSKGPWLYGKRYGVLWRMALEALSRAKYVIFIGYSMSLADMMASWLFRTGLARSEAQICILVDPAGERNIERFKAIYGEWVFANNITLREWLSDIHQ